MLRSCHSQQDNGLWHRQIAFAGLREAESQVLRNEQCLKAPGNYFVTTYETTKLCRQEERVLNIFRLLTGSGSSIPRWRHKHHGERKKEEETFPEVRKLSHVECEVISY